MDSSLCMGANCTSTVEDSCRAANCANVWQIDIHDFPNMPKKSHTNDDRVKKIKGCKNTSMKQGQHDLQSLLSTPRISATTAYVEIRSGHGQTWSCVSKGIVAEKMTSGTVRHVGDCHYKFPVLQNVWRQLQFVLSLRFFVFMLDFTDLFVIAENNIKCQSEISQSVVCTDIEETGSQ